MKIHYASLGEGPLVVMIHGFPDFWYSWRHQMDALSRPVPGRRDRSARLQPERQAEGRRELRHAPAGRRRGGGHPPPRTRARDHRRARLGRHGGVAVRDEPAADDRRTWSILNLPHPNGLLRELRSNPEQIKNSEYARNFQRMAPTDPTVFFGRPMTAETLSDG